MMAILDGSGEEDEADVTPTSSAADVTRRGSAADEEEQNQQIATQLPCQSSTPIITANKSEALDDGYENRPKQPTFGK